MSAQRQGTAPRSLFGCPADMAIRILIADDHAIVAEGLRHMIEAQPDMKVIGCVQDGREAVSKAIENSPDVILMDHAMPVLNGTEATCILCKRRPHSRVIILSMYADPIHVYRALQAGAMGYVVKKSAATELVNAVRTVHGGRRYLSKPLSDDVIDRFLGKFPAIDPLERLTSRERQVLQMLADGHTIKDIASDLSLSPKTVETYRARLMDKLRIYDLAGLVKFAIQQGVASLD